MEHIKTVKKHWGYELWIADGTIQPYALKRILFKAGHRTSLQVHKFKFETNYVLNGIGKFYVSHAQFNIEKFLIEGMFEKDIEEFEKTFQIIDLEPGVVINNPPGFVHRVVAITDLEFIEASTPELDDVIRLQDDNGRTHGKILYEHNY